MPNKVLRACCYSSLGKTIREATITHGLKPWVIFASSNEIGIRSLSFTAEMVKSLYKIEPQKIVSIECFDGDPFDFPNATFFSDKTANIIRSFLDTGFWKASSDLVVSCPTGICISPSIVKSIQDTKGLPIVFHSSKDPKFSPKIIKYMTS